VLVCRVPRCRHRIDLEPIYEDISPNYGFAFGILLPRRLSAAPVALEWYGVISTNGNGHTDATMLLFAQDQRIIHRAGRGVSLLRVCPNG